MVERRPRRLRWWLLLALAAGALWLYCVTRDPRPKQQAIAVPAGEETLLPRIVASAVAVVERAHVEGRPFGRDGFAKAHGCVRASVSVGELEPRLRHGLFARPGSYEAWVRFSNADARTRSDQRRDVRGFALKVMGVPGTKLLAAERDAGTQDFVLADSPRFFVADVRQYAEWLEHAARGSQRSYFFPGGLWQPWRWRVRQIYLAERMRRSPPRSVTQTRYHSASAYRLGPEQFVKYGVRPCEPRRPARRDRTEGMLREALRDELRQGPACFELTVQLQVAGKNMPIEDPTVLWSEGDSPQQPVARITIPGQDLDDPALERFCEDLSFTPWHSLPEHEPVGGLNRVRKAVYLEVSRYRHARNGSPRAEPRGYCLDLTGAACPAGEAASVPPPTAAVLAPAAPKPRTAPPKPTVVPTQSESGSSSAPEPVDPSPEQSPPTPPPTPPTTPPTTPPPPTRSEPG